MRHSIKILCGTLLLCVIVSCTSGAHPSHQDIETLMEQGAVLVDVRTQEEFDSGHLKDAILLPFGRILELPDKVEVTLESPIIVYCRSGARSDKAKKTLEAAGYTNVHNAGGYEDLKAQGME